MNTPTLGDEVVRARLIVFNFTFRPMRGPINFNNELLLPTREICKIGSDCLSATLSHHCVTGEGA